MRLLYAGVGSRKTPAPVLAQMRRIAERLALRGFILRSGAADGADTSFEEGADLAPGSLKEIWVPWAGFNGRSESCLQPSRAHLDLAAEVHPNWGILKQSVRRLHGRNVGQILGAELDAPVAFVVCWTPDGCQSEADRTRRTGGTATAIALASRRGIPVFNLQRHEALQDLGRLVASLSPQDHRQPS